MNHYKLLAKECVRLGGKLVLKPLADIPEDEDEVKDFFRAPFTDMGLGFYWEKRRILVASDENVPASAIIHEMGHVFAAEKNPDDQKMGDDELKFLGWEYVLAMKIGLTTEQWLHENKDYVVDDHGNAFGYMEHSKAIEVIRRMVQNAKRRKLIVRGIPVAIR